MNSNVSHQRILSCLKLYTSDSSGSVFISPPHSMRNTWDKTDTELTQDSMKQQPVRNTFPSETQRRLMERSEREAVEIPQDRWCLAGRRCAWSCRPERDVPLRLPPSPLKHTHTHTQSGSWGSSQWASVSLSDTHTHTHTHTHTEPHGAQHLHMTTRGMPLSLLPLSLFSLSLSSLSLSFSVPWWDCSSGIPDKLLLMATAAALGERRLWCRCQNR